MTPLENRLLCAWKQISTTSSNTSARKSDDKENPMYKCKYECTGREYEPCYIHFETDKRKYK